jgi:WD40 repeat protein
LNLKSGVNISTHSAESVYISVAMDYGGERVLAGSTDKSILVFNTVTGKQLNSFVGHGEKINAVTWSSSKEKCVSGSDDRQIKIWDIEKGSNLNSISCGRAVKVVTCNTV